MTQESKSQAFRRAFVDAAANSLIDARHRSVGIEGFAGGLQPNSAGEAYAIQESVLRRVGEIGGWKAGQIERDQPLAFAPILRRDVLSSPAICPTSSFRLIGIEAEVVVCLRHDLPRALAPFSRIAVEEAIGSVHAAIEVVGSRFIDWQSMQSLAILADNICNGALIIGSELSEWRSKNLASPGFRVWAGGRPLSDIQPNPAGDPIDVLRSVADHCANRGLPLTAGCMVTTGSCSGMTVVTPGTTAEVRMGTEVLVTVNLT